jgi:hypothetical protein
MAAESRSKTQEEDRTYLSTGDIAALSWSEVCQDRLEKYVDC